MSSDESKAQDYLLDLKRVSCKNSGKYKLKLELQASNSNYDLSQVKVETPAEFIDFEITDESLQNQVPLTGGEVTYHFPKGSFKDDVEVFISIQITKQLEEQSETEPTPSLLTGKLIIHPRHHRDANRPSSAEELALLTEKPDSSIESPTAANDQGSTSEENPNPSSDKPSPSKDEPNSSKDHLATSNEEGNHQSETNQPDLLNNSAKSLKDSASVNVSKDVSQSDQDPAGISSLSINLYVKLEDENIQQLAGKIWYQQKFNVMEDEEEQRESTLPLEDEVKNVESDGEKEPEQVPVSLEPKPVIPDKQPSEGTSIAEYLPNPDSSLVGSILIIAHAANLPTSPLTLKSRPFVKGFVRCFDENTLSSESRHVETQPSQNATLSPLWEQEMHVLIDQADVVKASLVLQLADFATLETLSEFQIPVLFLEPFHQYHLDMICSSDNSADIHLYASILYQPSELPSSGGLMYTALEANILSLDTQVANPAGPLIVSACLCHDFLGSSHSLQTQDLRLTSVHFPNPHSSSFMVSSDARSVFGHTQLSVPSRSETHPQWYQQFLFVNQRELSSIFTDTSALLIYLSAAASAFNGKSWKLSQQIGVALQNLNNTVFEALTDPKGKAGVKVHALKFQSTSLHGPNSSPLGINLTLRLITGKNIQSTISSSSPEFLPSLESFCYQKPAVETDKENVRRTEDRLKKGSPTGRGSVTPLPVPLRQPRSLSPLNGYRRRWPKMDEKTASSSPPYDAMQNLLDRVFIVDNKPGDQLIPTRLPPESLQPARRPEENPDRFTLSVLESQQRELDNYRQALQRMGEEMVALQQQVSRLEGENSKLRRQLNMHEDAARALVTAENAELLPKAELLDKFVTLKQALSQQVEESTNYRDKVLRLQNQLIKLNDKERTYIQQEKQLVAQTNLLSERNDKIKKLENTCRQQEMALEKMEKLLKKRLSKSPLASAEKPLVENPVVDALNAENHSLKAQLAQLKVDSKPEVTSPAAAEKLMTELQLEKAKKRIASLEKEIVEKARDWGREKTAMRLNLDSDRDSGRYRSLPPLEQPYDFAYNRRVDDYADRRYMGQRPPQNNLHSRTSPLF